MGKDKSQTIGHKIYLGLHTVLAQKLDAITKIVIDDKTAWQGDAMDAQIQIDKPDLFGGDEGAGGWEGAIDVMSGSATQAQNSYLKRLLRSTTVPAFRGVASLVFRKNYIGNIPTLRPVEVKGRAIYHGYGSWLPSLAPVPALGNGTSEAEQGYIYIAIDASYSMFAWPFERVEYAKTAVSNTLETLKGASPSVRIVTFGESATALDAVEYLNASDADIDAMKSWVAAIAYSGTAGTDVSGSGSNWAGAVESAPAFFGDDDNPDPSSGGAGVVFLGGVASSLLEPDTFGTANADVNSARNIVIITDGLPEPTSSVQDAIDTIDGINSVVTRVIHVGGTDTTYSEQVQTHSSGVVTITGEAEGDISLDFAGASKGANAITAPVKMTGQWSLGRFSGIWPASNYANISLDPLYDTVTANNPNVVTAIAWIDISAVPDGAEIYYSDTLTITGDNGTAVHSYPDYLKLSTITQAQYDANSEGTLQVTRNTAYLGSGNVENLKTRQHTITKGAGSKYLRVELRCGGCNTVALVTRQVVSEPVIAYAGTETESLETVLAENLGDHVDRNPAHILRDLLIAPWYGGSGDTSLIGDSFATAAQTLYDEGFGLTFLFDTPSDRLGIKQEIEQHIGGHIYESVETGKWEIKLVRDDYDVGTLTTFDGDMITEVVRVERPMQEELYNQITIEWTKREDGKVATVTDHNTAGIQALGYISPFTVPMRGISYEALASRVLRRELLSRTVPLWRGTIKVTYLPSGLDIGSAIIIDDSRIGMNSVVCRITEVDRGDGRSNEVTLSFVEDMFSLADDALVATDSIAPEDTGPQVAQYRIVEEAPHWVSARNLGDAEIAQRLDDDPDLGYLMATCNQPSDYHFSAYIAKYNGTNWYRDGTCGLAPTAFLTARIDGDADSVTLTTDAPDAFYEVTSTDLIMIDSEIMRIDGISVANSVATITVGRGALDTVPEAHNIGAAVQFFYEALGTDGDIYTSGQTASVRLLPRTMSESLAPSLATTDTVTFASRAIRPLPPGNFQLEAAYSLSGIQTGDLDGTWNHRDRLTQTTATPEDYADGDVGPEAGTSYTPQRRILEALDDIFDASDLFDLPDLFGVATRRGPFDYASTTGKTHAFSTDSADLFDASDIFDLSDIFEDAFDPATVGIELGVKSVRGGYDNWQTKWIRVDPLLPPINLTATEV